MIEALFSINFAEYFTKELKELLPMQGDGLITITASGLQVLPVGRLLIRNICMVFDKYLAQKNQQQFSKVI
jgi:oxygen-independent coproporphyrinogen-3 oxidase